MYNNTSSICFLNNSGTDILIWQIGAFLFPILGIPGHFLVIITSVYSTRQHFNPITLYFIAISISESIYLIFLFWDWLDAIDLAPDPRQILDCAFFYPFVTGTGFISLLLIVQLNLVRIFIIHKPQKISFYLTYKRVLIKIFLTFSFTLSLFIFHYRFSLYYDSKSFIIFGQSCGVYDHAQVWFYLIWPYIQLFFRLALCLIILCCTIYIFYNRCYTKSDMKIFSHRRQQNTFSLVLIVLSIYTFAAVIPICIVQIFNKHMWKYEFECLCYNCMIQTNRWKLINVICIMWESSIYMNKFYIKLIFSSEFRYDLKQLIFGRSTNGINSKLNSLANRSSLE